MDAPLSYDSESSTERFTGLVQRLNAASLRKFYVPLRDIDWDAPEHRLRAGDARFELSPSCPLAQGTWYRELPATRRSALGLAWLTQTLAYGVAFESVLSRGLLNFTAGLPPRTPVARYALHELAEEAHHSMMFQELIDRIGRTPAPRPLFDRLSDPWIIRSGHTFPELFFFAVLAGEIFIDADNRAMLRDGERLHPLVRRVLQIHVTEEARHVSFAHAFLAEHLPRLRGWRRERLACMVPVLFAGGARLMLRPARALVREFAIPAVELERAYGPGTEHRRRVALIVAPVTALCAEHGLWQSRHRWLWGRLGLSG
jgi:hypothetical protein